MNPIAVIDCLKSLGHDHRKLERIAKGIVLAETVAVSDLAGAGLSGSDIIAVRRALGWKVRGAAMQSCLADAVVSRVHQADPAAWWSLQGGGLWARRAAVSAAHNMLVRSESLWAAVVGW